MIVTRVNGRGRTRGDSASRLVLTGGFGLLAGRERKTTDSKREI